jgi:U3 small nucleolar RNA-associated protein 7
MDHLSIGDKKARGLLTKRHERITETREFANRARILQPSKPGYLECEGLERTWKVKQQDIAEQIPIISANKIFDLRLNDGPYMIDYSRNGRSLLIGGQSGHIAAFNWKTGQLFCELWTKERIRDVKWLHNESFFAVSQSKYVYIYDSNGIEIHVLRKHQQATCLDFLPYHFLLVSIGKSGILHYQDISTGSSVAEINTKQGTSLSMRQNPANAIIHSGHVNGTVCLWSPNMSSPLTKMLCHRGSLTAISIDRTGTYMVTSGLDGQVRTWDLRNYKLLESYFSPLAATSIDISQLGLLSVGY